MEKHNVIGKNQQKGGDAGGHHLPNFQNKRAKNPMVPANLPEEDDFDASDDGDEDLHEFDDEEFDDEEFDDDEEDEEKVGHANPLMPNKANMANGRGPHGRRVTFFVGKQRADDKGQGSSPVPHMESLGPISRDGVTWHLPEMKGDRTEPAVEIQYSRTIAGNENDKGSFRGYVFFSWPGESNTKICGDSVVGSVLSSSSEASGVAIVFEQCVGIDRKLSKKKNASAINFKAGLVTADMEMEEVISSRGMELPSSGLKHKLMEQEHRPNTDLNLLTAAYLSTSKEDFIVPDPAIYNQRTPLGNTVLHLAASCGNNAMVEKVAQPAPDLFTVTNTNYDTALHAAARAGHGSAIQFMLNTYLPFVRRETDGHHEDQTTLQMMLLVSLTLLRNKQGNTFFHEAFLVNAHNGAHIFRAFQDSFMKDNPELEADFKKIVNHLAAFATNSEGKSLLYVAIEVGCKQVVDQLLDICFEYDLKPQGKSPFLPALTKRNIDMLQTILSKKPSWIHLRNEEGRLPLHQAAFVGYHEGVSYLVRRCPSCTIERDNHGFFPIHLACIQGHVKVVKELLKCYPDPTEMLDENGQTLLHVAAKSGKYEVVRYILQYILQHPKLEIMINQKDNKGNTPLHSATLHWHPKIVHLLTWDNRVNLTILNQENQTALDIADLRHDKNPSLAQRLTWNALQSAGTPRSYARSLLSKETIVGEEKRKTNNERYKDRIDTLILVSTLIITASFAAGFAMPGDVDQGTAVMLNHVMFHLFIFSLTISIFGAIIATIILLWARLDDLQLMLFAVNCAMPVLGISLTTLSLAYLAGVYLVASKLSWLATTFLVLSVILMAMVVLLYALLWLPSSSTIPFIRYISYYPFLLFAEIAEGKIGANHKVTSDAPGALFGDKLHSANDAWRKLHSDPLLKMRQRQLAMIKKSFKGTGPEEKTRDKKERKKHSSKRHMHSSSRHQSDLEDDTSERRKRKTGNICKQHHKTHSDSEYDSVEEEGRREAHER